jgi:hypothetical protein
MTDVPPLLECMDMRWWPWWERHILPRALGLRTLYASRAMMDAMLPWPPRLRLHQLVWWTRADVVAVHLATQEFVVAPITSIMHVKVQTAWERHVRTEGWGDLIHAPEGTVFQFRRTGKRVAVTQTWRLQPKRKRL